MPARIALLGWGSLLWEGGAEFDRWHGPWQNDGPILNVEFSRVSQRRCGALTLVIDPENGVPVRSAWCLSRRQTIEEAADDLRKREETSPKNIGSVGPKMTASDCRFGMPDAIRTWAKEHDLDGVVWTNLQSNFASSVGTPFSVAAALRYLDSLDGEALKRAREYFERAPSFVQTPLREAVLGSL